MIPFHALVACTTFLALVVFGFGAAAAPNAAAAPSQPGPRGLSELGSSREPIAIDADRLEVFDKEGRAVFSGNVVVVQGETTMKCAAMDVLYESSRGRQAPAARQPGAGLGDDSSIRRMDCRGPVTITTKSQVATGERAEFDRGANKVYLIGNAALVDGPNVIKGDRVAYDLATSVARVEGSGNGGRVRTLIVPSSQKDAKPDKPQRRATPEPEQKPRKAARAESGERTDRDARPKAR